MSRWLLLLALLAGCAPVLDDDDATGDDDDTTGDDDDATMDDDDATGDDDDSVDPEGCTSFGSGDIWVQGPPDAEGWFEGTIDVADGAVLLTEASGQELTWRVSGDEAALLPEYTGPGRVWWSTPGLSGWGGDFVFGLEWQTGIETVLLVNVVELELVEVPDWGLTLRLDPVSCSDVPLLDACGVAHAAPMTFDVTTPDGVYEGTLAPGEGFADPTVQVEHRFGRQFVELECDDVPFLSWSAVVRQTFLTWDG